MTIRSSTFSLVLVIATLSAMVPSTAQTTCAGRWRVTVESDNPTCNPGNIHHVRIDERGAIAPDKPGHSYKISGTISQCKSITFVITRQAETVRGGGALSAGLATGDWKGKNPKGKTCSGIWTAARTGD